MTSYSGIAGLLGSQLTLEVRIEAKLKSARTRSELEEEYVDPVDQQNVRQRALISALLDACFEHGFPDNETDSVTTEVGQEPGIWSELANARRDFNRDANHLNNGNKAENCLSPIPRESIIPSNIIGADRELLIIWLATIEIWDKKRDGNSFQSYQAIFDAAAEVFGTKSSSYKTNRSEMKKSINRNGTRFSKEEQKFYQSLISLSNSESATKNESSSAFGLLLPATLALSKHKTPARLSANKLQG